MIRWEKGWPGARPALGAVLLVAYVMVCSATVALSGRHVRPLYEGVGPPPAYQWVKPPSQFASGNVVPHEQTVTLPLSASGTPEAGPSSSDAQLILNMPKGAIVAHAGDTGVEVKITPLDPSTLLAVPAGQQPAGNVYRVEMTYKPSGAPVDRLGLAANVVMIVPFNSQTILYSPDGKSPWQPLATQPLSGQTTLGSSFTAPGYFVGAAAGSSTTTTVPRSGGGNGGTVVIAIIVVVLVVLLAGAAFLLSRRRRPVPPPRPASRNRNRYRAKSRSRRR